MLDNKGFDDWSKNYDESTDENQFPFIGYKNVL